MLVVPFVSSVLSTAVADDVVLVSCLSKKETESATLVDNNILFFDH